MHNIAPRTDLEKRAIFFRLLIPLLATEWLGEGEIDLSGVQLTHYRLKDQGTRRLNLKDGNGEVGLLPPGEVGSAEGRDLLRAMLSAIIQRMNDCASHASQPGVLSATYSPAGSRRTPAVTVRIGALPAA